MRADRERRGGAPLQVEVVYLVRRQGLGVRCVGRVESGQCAATKLDALRHVY
jgi:hypothetical protein